MILWQQSIYRREALEVSVPFEPYLLKPQKRDWEVYWCEFCAIETSSCIEDDNPWRLGSFSVSSGLWTLDSGMRESARDLAQPRDSGTLDWLCGPDEILGTVQ
jgi:hypothetical protein